MATTEAKTEYYVGFLGGIWDSLAKFAYPLVRITCGALLIPHGLDKFFGEAAKGTSFLMAMTLGGHGKEAGPFAESWLPWTYYIGALELVGGILLVIGLLTRVVAAQVVVFMFVATFFVHLGFGFFWFKNPAGYEMPLMWLLLAIVVLIRGGGDYSIDKKLGKEF